METVEGFESFPCPNDVQGVKSLFERLMDAARAEAMVQARRTGVPAQLVIDRIESAFACGEHNGVFTVYLATVKINPDTGKHQIYMQDVLAYARTCPSPVGAAMAFVLTRVWFVARDILKTLVSRGASTFQGIEDVADPRNEGWLRAQFASERLDLLLGRLPHAQRLALEAWLTFEGGYRDMAERLGITEAAFRNALGRARDTLSQFMSEDNTF